MPGCSNLVGSCIPVGAMLKQGCIQFKCIRKPSRCGLVLVRGGRENCTFFIYTHNQSNHREIILYPGNFSLPLLILNPENSSYIGTGNFSFLSFFVGKIVETL